MRMRASTLLESLPGWREVVQLDATARRAAIADPATRARLREGAARGIDQSLGVLSDWNLMEIAPTAGAPAEPWVGRSLHRSCGGARHRHRRRADRRRVAGSARAVRGAPVTHAVARAVRRGLGRPRRGLEGRTRRCSAAPTRARTSTSCATRTIRRVVLGEVVRDRGLLVARGGRADDDRRARPALRAPRSRPGRGRRGRRSRRVRPRDDRERAHDAAARPSGRRRTAVRSGPGHRPRVRSPARPWWSAARPPRPRREPCSARGCTPRRSPWRWRADRERTSRAAARRWRRRRQSRSNR